MTVRDDGDGTRRGLGRRGVLRGGATAVAALGTGVGVSGTATAQSSFDGWMDGVGNYDGTVADRTGQGSVTIRVGAEGNGGAFAYAPPAVRVDPGTEVTWEWTGQGAQHNVVAQEGADFESDLTGEAGFTFSQTFDSAGTIKYYCTPHRSLGMRGVVVVGGGGGGGGGGSAGGGGAGGQEPDWGGWLEATDNYDGTVDRRGEGSVTVQVGASGNGGNFAFDPAGLWVDPGTEVTWEWTGQGGQHNVLAEEGPTGLESDLTGDAGFTYSHTFEEGGITTYYCQPHRSLGMVGAVAVGDDVPTVAADGGGGGDPADGGGDGGEPAEGEGTAFPFPGGEAGLVGYLLAFGLPGLAAVAVLYGEYYGSRDRQEVEYGDVALEAQTTEPTTEIGHDEFDPTGTASLVILYFLILVVMWVFVYFVEFLGGGPTIIG